MEKNIRDYLHLYLGCGIYIDDKYSDGTLTDVSMVNEGAYVLPFGGSSIRKPWKDGYKLVLRPLSDMTEEEAAVLTKFNKIDTVIECPYFNNIHKLKHGEQLRYLLARHFDLFCLIEAGLAIDKTKLTTHA